MKDQKAPQQTSDKAKIKQEQAPVTQEQFAPLLPLVIGGTPLPPDIRRKQVIQLQKTVGNQAVQRWLTQDGLTQPGLTQDWLSQPGYKQPGQAQGADQQPEQVQTMRVQRAVVERDPTDTAEPNPLPVFMPWTAGAMSQIEMVRMRAETMLVEVFGGQIKTVNADAGMKVTEVDSDALKTEYAKKAAEKDGKTSPADIQEYVNNKDKIYPGRLDGFAFKSQNVVYVNKSESEDNQVVIVAHEMLHMNAAGDWASTVRADIDEGTTELLTQKACAKVKATKKAYGAQMGIVQKIIPVVGEGTLINAYFGGGPILVNAIDAVVGKGTFDLLMMRITAKEEISTFDEKIGRLLDPKRATWLRQKIDEMRTALEGWVSDNDIARVRELRATIDQEDMPQVRQELYPLVNSLWSDTQKSAMINILS